MSTPHKVVILGGGYAGLMAAARAARAGDKADIVLVDARPGFTQRIRFHELLAGGQPRSLPYQPLLEKRGVRFLQGWADSLDRARQLVVVALPEGGHVNLPYDTLIVALGSRTATSTPGVAEHMLRLDDPEEINKVQPRLRQLAQERGRVLIVGGGLTGIETAAELAERLPGLRITLLSSSELRSGWSALATNHFHRTLDRMGVELIEGARVQGVEHGRAWLADGSAVPFDMGVWAGGFEAAPFGRLAGLPVTANGRIEVDEFLRVPGYPNILVAGDSAAPLGGGVRMSCAAALPMGASAGSFVAASLRGRQPKAFDFGFALRCVSLGRRNGLIQFTTPSDTPTERVWTGARGAFMKELVCSFTVVVPFSELRTGFPWFRWPHGLTEQLQQHELALE